MQSVAFISNYLHYTSKSDPKENCRRMGCTQFVPCFYSSQHLKKKKICRCDRRHPSSKSLGSCAGSSPWSVSTGQRSVAISLSCFSHTQIILRLPKEAHFPNLWSRCLSDWRRTRWPSQRPGLGMNNHSEKGIRTTKNQPKAARSLWIDCKN